MDWIQVFTIIGVLGGFMFFILQRLEKDMDKIGNNVDASHRRLDTHAQRIDQSFHMSNDKHDAQMARIDQLYNMFVDLLKERK